MLHLLGLQDSYTHDGRVIVEQLEPEALSAPMRRYPHTYQRLATAYKQLNAPFGELSVGRASNTLPR